MDELCMYRQAHISDKGEGDRNRMESKDQTESTGAKTFMISKRTEVLRHRQTNTRE
jgi:hypothetical protein